MQQTEQDICLYIEINIFTTLMYPEMVMLVWGQCVLCVSEGHQAIEESVLKMERKGLSARSLARPWMSYWTMSQVNTEAFQGLPG